MRTGLIGFLLFITTSLVAQDVGGFFSDISERLRAKDILRLSGNLGGQVGYNYFDEGGSGALPRNQPFNWSGNASVNLDILGIQAPFSAAISNRNTLYNLPSYSFVGVSPTYRWITLHAGDRNLNFSPYSLAGVNFRGVGFELKPGKFYVAGMRGQLRRARIQDISSIQNLETDFRRIGTGVKFGFDSGEGSQLMASVFSSADQLENANPQDSLLLANPERNMVLSFSGGHQLSKFLRVEGEWARSVLTRDERSPLLENPSGRVRLFGLFSPRVSTTASDALKLRIGLSPSFGKVNFQYERIGPEYRTHGSLFFQNDLENFTAGFSAPLFKKKVDINTQIGIQRNDLDNASAASLNRFVGSLGINYAISAKVNTSLSLSNFVSTNRYKAIALNNLLVDSIVLAQTQQSADLTTSVLVGAKNEHVFVGAAGLQRAALIRDDRVDDGQTSTFSLLMISYTYAPEKAPGSLSASMLYHRNQTPDVNINTLGPSLGYSRKAFREKGKINLSLNYNWTTTDLTAITPGLPRENAGILQATLGGNYNLGKKQGITANISVINAGTTSTRPGYTDAQFRLGYNLGF
ncbi:hypothetical protein [Lewinella sp. W8]|uniref:hypothetical protein n=1 Tax=Lewinella sp. W8 TaxID=2528208 RepID=UPI0010672494|nr:hypothetical protein [Lewinella sp. W8]MTB53839.1 hypothetical protein [Lewinella sp. W8]